MRSSEYLQTNKNSFFNILWAKVREKNTLIRILEGHTSTVNSVAVTPEGTKIVSGSWDNTIKVWDLASGRLLNTLEGHTSSVNSVAVTPDGNKIVSGSWDTTIMIWDPNNGSNIFACKFDSNIDAIAISNNKNIMAIGDSNGFRYAIRINDQYK